MVRVVEGSHRGVPVFWVEYRKADGKRTGKPFPRTRAGRNDAMQFAEGVVEQQSQPVKPAEKPLLTVAEIGKRFMVAEFPAFRPNTMRMCRDAWRTFEAFVGPHTIAEDLGRDTMSALRAELDGEEWAVTTIRTTFGWVRRVYRWAADGDLIVKNRVGAYQYKIGKDKRPRSPDEFRMEEFAALLCALRLDFANQWRPHVALGVCGYQGARQWAVLHLKWDDLDFPGEIITWRAEWDKMGNTWTQPMREPTRALLEVARAWREECRYLGPYVFFPASKLNKRPFYTEQSLSKALHAAEKRAGVTHHLGRGAHGLRRLLAGEVAELTGDAVHAMQAIGDRDIRMAQRYIKKRDDRLVRTFDTLDERLPEPHPKGKASPAQPATNLRTGVNGDTLEVG